ncbi:hypothetical protein [Methylobacterium crusticola]|uniref:hypothetical protein n=1 Tax=Methylobacterium crusticola TaxID=1697972 RepID=UPI000FFC1C0D|nr:hypothetical protein [Methylobacterium crusticola]
MRIIVMQEATAMSSGVGSPGWGREGEERRDIPVLRPCGRRSAGETALAPRPLRKQRPRGGENLALSSEDLAIEAVVGGAGREEANLKVILRDDDADSRLADLEDVHARGHGKGLPAPLVGTAW